MTSERRGVWRSYRGDAWFDDDAPPKDRHLLHRVPLDEITEDQRNVPIAAAEERTPDQRRATLRNMMIALGHRGGMGQRELARLFELSLVHIQRILQTFKGRRKPPC